MHIKYKSFFDSNFGTIFAATLIFLQIFYLNTNITNYDGVQYALTARDWAINCVDLKSEVFYTYTNYGAITEYRFNSTIIPNMILALYIKVFGFSMLSLQVYSFICSILIILLLKILFR